MEFVKKYIEPILAGGKQRIDSDKISIYYAEGMKGFNTDPSGSMHSVLFDLIGAKNVAQTDILEGKGMTAVSPEQIYLWNPDAILVWSGNFDDMDSYKYIPVLHNGHVYRLYAEEKCIKSPGNHSVG